jgi:hypothetical protein
VADRRCGEYSAGDIARRGHRRIDDRPDDDLSAINIIVSRRCLARGSAPDRSFLIHEDRAIPRAESHRRSGSDVSEPSGTLR